MTPLMQQYWEIKNVHADKILLFRMGDFYEMFHQDAEVAAPVLNIALTVRNRKSSDDTKMCGVPYHSIAGPIAKLLSAGHKVAVCEQIEDPALAKGLVKRAVTRILSPGMVFDPTTLEQKLGHFISAFDDHAVSFLEPTTGEAFFYRVATPELRQRLWSLLQPKELVLTPKQRQNFSSQNLNMHLSMREPLVEQVESLLPESAQRILTYACELQGPELRQTVPGFVERQMASHLQLSLQVLRQLEVFHTYGGEVKGSLCFAVDRTQSAAGARLLKQWLSFPLIDPRPIRGRQDQIEFWRQNLGPLKDVRRALASLGDIERRIGKISNPNCQGRDLLALGQSLKAAASLAPVCPKGQLADSAVQLASELGDDLERSLVEDPPLSVRQGGVFRRGYSADLDKLILLTDEAQGLLQALENEEKANTGIGSLKVRFNNVFGYYIEVTKTHLAKIPDHFQRKQTLANAERFTTARLSELESQILSAHAKRSELEFALFQTLRSRVLACATELVNLARALAELDVLTGFAWLAVEENWARPEITTERAIELVESRHPVVEQEVKTRFVPNSVHLKAGECLLLTGPNMAGKSTLMRQVAIAVLLAQCGSFVPARSAKIPIYSRIFTRIGASDFLSEGLSTFMVEMKETAEILHLASSDSLVILDEIGRGTSTYDGLSLAQGILEYLIQGPGPMVLFATHYHELTVMAAQFAQVRNAHMSIREKNGEIQFLHTLVDGPASKSYGIHVAKLAGLPASVTARARRLLQGFEQGKGLSQTQLTLVPQNLAPARAAADEGRHGELLNEIREVCLQKMTPLEALNQIASWQRSLT